MAIVATGGGRRRQPASAEFGVALIDLSTGEFSVAEYAGRTGSQALRDEIAVLQPREIVVAGGHDIAPIVPRGRRNAACRSPRSRAGTSSSRPRARRCSNSCASASSKASASSAGRRRCAPRGALLRYLRDTQKADLAHVRAHPAQGVGGLPADRSDDARAPRGRRVDGGRPARVAAARDRSHDHGDGRPAAAGLAAAAAGRRSKRFAIASMPSKSSRSAPPIAASCARR